MTKIMILGDVHGEWGFLNELLNKKKPYITLQCGDFGIWPRLKYIGWPPKLNLHEGKLYFCLGNHEDYWAIKSTLRDNDTSLPIELCSDVYMMYHRSVLTLPDKRNVLFMGGADSIDKKDRMIGVDWFPEEILTERDLIGLPDIKIDIVISHTCPHEFYVLGDTRRITYEKSNDPTKHVLSFILEKYKPKLWYFGHYHNYKTGYTNECRWYCLSMPRKSGWWKWIDT